MCPDWSNQLSLNAGLVSEPQSKVEEDGEGQHRRRGRQGADERGHSSVPEHQLSVSRGPRQEAERAAGDAAEVSGGHESHREAVGTRCGKPQCQQLCGSRSSST